jgi:anti-anti-sigma factor
MSFTVNATIESGLATMTLAGRLDANTAQQFKEVIEQVAQQMPHTVALYVGELEYMASAGIRMLVFTKQKMGATTDIYMVGAIAQIVHTLEMTGVDKSVIFVDSFEPTSLAN